MVGRTTGQWRARGEVGLLGGTRVVSVSRCSWLSSSSARDRSVASRRIVVSRARAIRQPVVSPLQCVLARVFAYVAISCLPRSVRPPVRPFVRRRAENHGHRVEFRETGLVVRRARETRARTRTRTYTHRCCRSVSRCVGSRPCRQQQQDRRSPRTFTSHEVVEAGSCPWTRNRRK